MTTAKATHATGELAVEPHIGSMPFRLSTAERHGTIALVNSEANAHELARRWNAHAGLVAALELALAYLEANRPKGNIRENFSALNEHENGVMKPLRAALAAATAEGGER